MTKEITRIERLNEWADNLTHKQGRSALITAVSCLIDGEDLAFGDDSLAPYWSSCGEPLIEGQDCFDKES